VHSGAAQTIELILILMLAVAALGTLARRLHIPYPILLVLGGLALGFVPGLPKVELEPDLVFLLFLPPILYAAA
jgi:CPA1 family monovalent cation:H+ antiporter